MKLTVGITVTGIILPNDDGSAAIKADCNHVTGTYNNGQLQLKFANDGGKMDFDNCDAASGGQTLHLYIQSPS
jgi:hypothetical protein